MRDSKLLKKVNLMYVVFMSALVSPAFATEEIDLMVYYTDDEYTDRKTRQQKKINDTLIKHLVSIANVHYKNSGLDIKLRHVHSEQVTLPDHAKDSTLTLSKLKNQEPPFDNIETLRHEYGADMVTLLSPVSLPITGGCGVAHVPLSLSHISNKPDVYTVSYVRVGTNGSSSCAESTLTHEIGHNMGIHHSPNQNARGGVFEYALGYGVENKFITVMPYSNFYGTRNAQPLFSTPKIICQEPTSSDPNTYPCGTVNKSDAVRAIQQTAPVISALYPTRVKDRSKRDIDNTAGSGGSDDSGGSLGYLVLVLIFIGCCRLFLTGKKE